MNADRKPYDAIASRIAFLLGETHLPSRRQIRNVVRQLGHRNALSLLEYVEELEMEGGLRHVNQQQRRTRGGAFLYLARQLVKPQTSIQSLLEAYSASIVSTARMHRQPAYRLRNKKGHIDNVKVVLVGRPGAVSIQPHCVMTMMQPVRGPDLSRNFPQPPTQKTAYTVYFTHEQWRQVADSLHDPDTRLHIEGWGVYDPELEGIAVYTMRATVFTRQHPQAEQQPDDPSA